MQVRPVSAFYWTNGRPEGFITLDWQSMPEDGLLWADLKVGPYRHRLLGADLYWVLGQSWGMAYPDARPKYGGALYRAWRLEPDGQVLDLGEKAPPEEAHIVAGVEIPDAIWTQLLKDLG